MIFVGSIKKGATGLITAFIIFLLRHLTFSHFFVQPSLPVIISKVALQFLMYMTFYLYQCILQILEILRIQYMGLAKRAVMFIVRSFRFTRNMLISEIRKNVLESTRAILIWFSLTDFKEICLDIEGIHCGILLHENICLHGTKFALGSKLEKTHFQNSVYYLIMVWFTDFMKLYFMKRF